MSCRNSVHLRNAVSWLKKKKKKREKICIKKDAETYSEPSQISQKELFAISPVPDLFFNKIAG